MMIVVAILLFALLVIVHELGHFLVARRNGVEVEEFGIGFPPRVFSTERGGVRYSLNLIPLGGFVKMKGESDSDRRPGSFGVASLWAKTKIMLAGVGMNMVAAFVILLVLAVTQLPTLIPGQFQIESDRTIVEQGVAVRSVSENSPAEAADMRAGDMIVRVADTEIMSAQQLVDTTGRLAGKEIDIVLERNQESYTRTLTLGEGEAPLGVAPAELETNRYTWAAPIVAFVVTWQIAGLLLVTVGGIIVELLSGAGSAAAEELVGPIGIVFILQNISGLGVAYLWAIVVNISVALAVFNALPIPALDGGRLAVIAGARALRKQLTEQVENTIHGTGFLALIGLIILISYLDVQRFF